MKNVLSVLKHSELYGYGDNDSISEGYLGTR